MRGGREKRVKGGRERAGREGRKRGGKEGEELWPIYAARKVCATVVYYPKLVVLFTQKVCLYTLIYSVYLIRPYKYNVHHLTALYACV